MIQRNLCLKGPAKGLTLTFSFKATATTKTSLKTQKASSFIITARSEATQGAKAGMWQIQA